MEDIWGWNCRFCSCL